MKVTVTAGNLGQGLQVVSRAVSSRTTLPILNNVLLQTADTGLQLTATNLEIGIRQVIPAEVQEEGGITVPARLLTDFVTSHPDEPLSMALDKKTQSLAVKSNRFDATIRGIDPADFPPVPSGVDGRKVKVDQADLKDAIEQTVIAASSDEGRPVLTGVYVHLNEGKATFAATDGHRLAVKTLAVQAEPGEGETIVIPARALSELSRILKTGDDGVEVTVGAQKNQVFFKTRDVELMSRLIEGTYPNYQQVIPKESAKKAVIERAAMEGALRRVAVLSKDKTNAVKLMLQAGTLTLHTSNPDLGEATEEVPAQYRGESLTTGFNARYILDALAVMDGESVTMEINTPLSPCLMKSDGDPGFLCVVMPMKI